MTTNQMLRLPPKMLPSKVTLLKRESSTCESEVRKEYSKNMFICPFIENMESIKLIKTTATTQTNQSLGVYYDGLALDSSQIIKELLLTLLRGLALNGSTTKERKTHLACCLLYWVLLTVNFMKTRPSHSIKVKYETYTVNSETVSKNLPNTPTRFPTTPRAKPRPVSHITNHNQTHHASASTKKGAAHTITVNISTSVTTTTTKMVKNWPIPYKTVKNTTKVGANVRVTCNSSLPGKVYFENLLVANSAMVFNSKLSGSKVVWYGFDLNLLLSSVGCQTSFLSLVTCYLGFLKNIIKI